MTETDIHILNEIRNLITGQTTYYPSSNIFIKNTIIPIWISLEEENIILTLGGLLNTKTKIPLNNPDCFTDLTTIINKYKK